MTKTLVATPDPEPPARAILYALIAKIMRRAIGTRTPSYHDLHITTAQIPRTRLFDLPYGLEVTCTRVTGWQLWRNNEYDEHHEQLAGEYDGPENWLVLDVGGHVIVDSRKSPSVTGTGSPESAANTESERD